MGSCVTLLHLLSPCGQAARFDQSVRPARFGAEDPADYRANGRTRAADADGAHRSQVGVRTWK